MLKNRRRLTIVAVICLWGSDVALPASREMPLGGLKTASVLQFPATGAQCYGLDPLGADMRLLGNEASALAMAGLNMPAPQAGSTVKLDAPYIRIRDELLPLNPVNCFDRIEVAFVYPVTMPLSHNGMPFSSSIVLYGVQAGIVGEGRDDFLRRREASLVQLFTALAQEWKNQNPN